MKIIGICGYARSGKDTLFEALERILTNKEIVRVAFADCLKRELDPLIQEQFGFSAWTDVDEEKELIRPIMVEYGRAKRKLDSKYWLKRGIEQVNFDDDKIYVFTDVRYLNELDAINNFESKTFFIHKIGNKPANEEECKNITPLRPCCDYDITFVNFKGNDQYEDPEMEQNKSFDKYVVGLNLLGTNTIGLDRQQS